MINSSAIRWWTLIEKNCEVEKFNDLVIRELLRWHKLSTEALSKNGESNQAASNSFSSLLQYSSDGSAMDEETAAAILRQDPIKTCQLVRHLVDFQLEVFNHDDSMRSTAQYIRDRPDLIVNRILNHVQYIFDIQSVEGILPRLNQVHLFHEEMKNFLTYMRKLFGDSKGEGMNANISNAVLINEIQRIVAISLSTKF